MMPDPTSDITTIIRAVIEAHHICWRAPEIEPDSMLADIGFDALDRVSLACALDEHFEIELPDAMIESWERVADVIASVEALAVQQAGEGRAV